MAGDTARLKSFRFSYTYGGFVTKLTQCYLLSLHATDFCYRTTQFSGAGGLGMSTVRDNGPVERWTLGDQRAAYREIIGWDELREEVRHLVRRELAGQLQAILGSSLDNESLPAGTGQDKEGL
jgi:hypothetical protein